jgi:hypothetical protein
MYIYIYVIKLCKVFKKTILVYFNNILTKYTILCTYQYNDIRGNCCNATHTCMYIYIHIHVYLYIHTRIYAYICIYTYVYIYMYIHINFYVTTSRLLILRQDCCFVRIDFIIIYLFLFIPDANNCFNSILRNSPFRE